jgi:hypothetical protein
MNAIVPIQPMPFGEIERMADAFAKSNLFGFKTKEQALVLMMISQAEGRHPALAARDYDVYQNKPAKKAEAMLRDFQTSGGVVKWHVLTDEKADATFSHPQAPEPLRIDWDMVRARKAGLAEKDLWKKYPRSMLRSRVVSEGVRAVWPGATSGMYVPEEMADMTQEPPHNGPTLEHEPASTPPEPKPETAREKINRETPLNPTPTSAPKTWAHWADSMEIAARDASNDDLGRMLASAEITEIVRLASMGEPAPVKTRILTAHDAIQQRYLANPPPLNDAEADIWGEQPVTEPAGAG